MRIACFTSVTRPHLRRGTATYARFGTDRGRMRSLSTGRDRIRVLGRRVPYRLGPVQAFCHGFRGRLQGGRAEAPGVKATSPSLASHASPRIRPTPAHRMPMWRTISRSMLRFRCAAKDGTTKPDSPDPRSGLPREASRTLRRRAPARRRYPTPASFHVEGYAGPAGLQPLLSSRSLGGNKTRFPFTGDASSRTLNPSFLLRHAAPTRTK